MVHGGIMGTRSIKHSNLRVTLLVLYETAAEWIPYDSRKERCLVFYSRQLQLGVFPVPLYLQSGCTSKDTASKSMGEPQPVVSKSQAPQLQMSSDLGFLEISQWKLNLLETRCIFCPHLWELCLLGCFFKNLSASDLGSQCSKAVSSIPLLKTITEGAKCCLINTLVLTCSKLYFSEKSVLSMNCFPVEQAIDGNLCLNS